MKFFYEKIPELKKLKDIFEKLEYKQIKLWPSVAPDAYEYFLHRKRGSSFFKFVRFIKFIFFIEKFKIEGFGKDKLLCTMLLDRKDHENLFRHFISSFNKNEILTMNALQKGKKNLWHFVNRFWFRLPNLFYIFGIYKYLKSNNFNYIIRDKLDRTYFVLLTYYMFKKIDYWGKIYELIQPKAYLAYAGYRNNDETIMTQICKLHGKKTFTTQHYALFDYPEFNPESVTYENFISDYFLVWGEASYNVLKKYIERKKFLITGNPLNIGIKKVDKKFAPKICVIFFDFPLYTQSNYDIIEIVSEFAKKYKDIKFYIKPHPVCDIRDYLDKVKDKRVILLDKYADKEKWMRKADFLIVHNTTIALEALKYQIPIFRYKDETYFDMDIPKNSFSNFKELDLLFSKILNKKDYIDDYYKYYYYNFYQPKNMSISDYYKKIILNKIN